jgi:hypothetical protein
MVNHGPGDLGMMTMKTVCDHVHQTREAVENVQKGMAHLAAQTC